MSIGNELYKINEENSRGVFYPSIAEILQFNGSKSANIDKVILGQNSPQLDLPASVQNGEVQLATINDVYAESFEQNDDTNLIDDVDKDDDLSSNGSSNNSLSVKAETIELTQFKPIELDDLDEVELELPLLNVSAQFATNNLTFPGEQLFTFESFNDAVEEDADIAANEITAVEGGNLASIEASDLAQEIYLFDELSDDIGIVFIFDEFRKDIVISDFDAGLDKINLEYFTDNSTLLSFLLDDEGFARAAYTASPTDFGRVEIDVEQQGDDVSIEINALSSQLLPGADGIGSTGANSYDMTILLSDVDVTELEFSDFVY